MFGTQNDFLVNAITATTTTSVAVANTQNCIVHTVNSPKASSGTITLQSAGGATTYCTFPIGSIGCFVLDAIFTKGLQIVTSAGDTVITTYVSYQ